MYKRILSFLIILSIFLAMSCPVFADYTSSNYTLADIWLANWKNATADNWLNSSWFSNVSSSVGDGSICALSDDGLHHTSNYQPSLGSGSDARGYFAYCQCDYCGQMFKCYSEDFSNAYDDHVAGMPATNYTSAGTLLITAEHNYCYLVGGSSYYYVCPHYISFSGSVSSYYTNCTVNCDGSFVLLPNSGSSSFSSLAPVFQYIVKCPVSGSYSRVKSKMCDVTEIYYNGNISNSSQYWSASSATFYSAGSSFGLSSSLYSSTYSHSHIKASGQYYPPKYSVIPTDTTVTNHYVNASRPTYNITYNLATVTQSGDYTVINNVYENQTIINEGDNIFIDPDTGDQYEIDNWEYDYTTRTYYCTLADGSLLEVTLGDTYVTVNLNGELEYYYYATPSEGDGVTGGDTDCTHDFALAEALEPTCTTGGYEVYVCKLCAATYKDTSFAIGHNYELVETVDPTVTLDESTLVCPGCNATEDLSYELTGDETFTVTCGSCSEEWTVAGSVESGYDLYRCSNCGDEYKDYTGEGVVRDDAGYWSWLQTWLQNFKTWLGEKLDALASGSGSGSGTGDLDVEVDMGDDVDYNITYTDEETGEETNITIKDFIGKFAFIKDIWKIGQTLISVVSEDAAYAYEFDPTIGNDATTDTGTEVATVSVEEEADTLLSSGSGAPSIPLDLGAAQSVYGFNYGGEVEMLDLSWYTPYKETVDKLVGGFLWLFFMWKLFQKAPGILSGASMDSSKAEDIKSGTKGKRR